MTKFLDLRKQYLTIKDEIDEAVQSVLAEAHFIGGPRVSAFERAFAEFQEAEHCVGVANATDGLEIAIEALGLPQGSEVIVPANSFIASSEAVTRAGHKVVFADVDPSTFNLTANSILPHLSPRTKAIIAVHLYGQPAPLDEILTLAKEHSLRVVEDAAQAVGATYRGRKVGALADVGVFSFYPGKNLGAYGDAGAVTTNSAEIAQRVRMIANHGRISKYDHNFEGRNSRLDALQAAVLSVKLGHIDRWTSARREVAAAYRQRLSGKTGIVLPIEKPDSKHVYHLFVVRSQNRDVLVGKLKQRGIETGIHYPIALPELKAYEYLGQSGQAPVSRQLSKEILSLPMGEHLTEQDVQAVADSLIEAMALDT